MKGHKILVTALMLVNGIDRASAGQFEIGLGGSFSASKYSEAANNWSRRWNGSLGYHFTHSSGVEVSYQDVYSVNVVVGDQTTTYHDQVYSLNWWQSVFPEKWFLQPYFKLGVAQLNRSIDIVYADGFAAATQYAQLSGVVGAGIRIPLHEAVSLSGEISSYLSEWRLSSLSDNFSFNAGVQFRF